MTAARDVPEREIDTVAEVTLVRLVLEEPPACSTAQGGCPQPQKKAFDVAPSVDPTLTVAAEARLRLVEQSAGRTIYETSYFHRGDKQQKFTAWGRDDGADVRTSGDEVLDMLGRCIALNVFGPATAEPARDLYKTTCKDER